MSLRKERFWVLIQFFEEKSRQIKNTHIVLESTLLLNDFI